MSEWQDIETAPKDKKFLALCNAWYGEINGFVSHDKSPLVTIAYGEPDERSDAARDGHAGPWYYESGGDAYVCWVRPTHWMPLPAPPKEQGQ